MKRRTRHDDADQEGWTSGGDLADVEETPRSSRGEVPAVKTLPSFSTRTYTNGYRHQEFVRIPVRADEKCNYARRVM